MRDPRERRTDQPVLVRIPIRVPVKGALLDEGDGGRRNEMALLIGRDDLVGNGIITQIGLAKTIGQTGDFAAIRRNAQNRARRAPDCAPSLTGFANNKAPVLHDLEGGSEFPGLGGLVDLRAKELVVVHLAIAVTVMKTPKPVSVEDEDFLILNRKPRGSCRRMQNGPFHLLGTVGILPPSKRPRQRLPNPADHP